MERRREISEIIIIDNNVEMDDNDYDDYENNERLNKIPALDRHQILFLKKVLWLSSSQLVVPVGIFISPIDLFMSFGTLFSDVILG